MPIIITDTNMEVPRPWIMASKLQDIGLDNLEADIVKGLGIGGNVGREGEFPPLLPKVSATGAGGIVAMMQGNLRLPTVPTGNNFNDNGQEQQQMQEMQQVELSEEEKEYMNKLQVESEALLQDLEKAAIPGAKIIDQKDGKTIGQIVSLPASGTPIVLAQMRLDQVGLLQSSNSSAGNDSDSGIKWSQTNRILIGDGLREYRYLPYIPLWWPDIDAKTGKAKIQ